MEETPAKNQMIKRNVRPLPMSPFTWEGWDEETPKKKKGSSIWWHFTVSIQRYFARALVRLCPRAIARVEVDGYEEEDEVIDRTVRLTPRIIQTPQVKLRFNASVDIKVLTPPTPNTSAEHQVRVRAREAVDVATSAWKLAQRTASTACIAATLACDAQEKFFKNQEAAKQAHEDALCLVHELEEEDRVVVPPQQDCCISCFEPFSSYRPQLTLICGHAQQECIECAGVQHGDLVWCFECENEEVLHIGDIIQDLSGDLSEAYDELDFQGPISPPPPPPTKKIMTPSSSTKKKKKILDISNTIHHYTPPLNKSKELHSSLGGLSTPSEIDSSRRGSFASPLPLPRVVSSPPRPNLFKFISTIGFKMASGK